MKYTLEVSYNCGGSYNVDMVSDDLDDFKKRCKELDLQGLRWALEDENGESVGICHIHAGIVETMTALNKPK